MRLLVCFIAASVLLLVETGASPLKSMKNSRDIGEEIMIGKLETLIEKEKVPPIEEGTHKCYAGGQEYDPFDHMESNDTCEFCICGEVSTGANN